MGSAEETGGDGTNLLYKLAYTIKLLQRHKRHRKKLVQEAALRANAEARSNNIFMRVIHAQATRILQDDYQRWERSSAKEINTTDEFTSTII